MICSEITKDYYAMWLGVDKKLLDETGVFFIYNPNRNERPVGYPGTLDVYAYINPHIIILSYGDKAAGIMRKIRGDIAFGMEAYEVHAILRRSFSTTVNHNIKYIYTHEKAIEVNPAIMLTAHYYEKYLDFFREANPQCGDTYWVKEYFHEIADKGYCHGIVEREKLVSVTDAPDMPFMSNRAQEIGVNTLSPYRGRGYAKYACLSCVKSMLHSGICPLWSTGADNVASQKLAVSIGFEKICDNLGVTIKDMLVA